MFPTKSNLIKRHYPIDVNVNGESPYDVEQRNLRHTKLLELFERQPEDFLSKPSVVLPEDLIPPPQPGSLELLKLKLNKPDAEDLFTTNELVRYSYNTLNMSSELDQNELNKFYDIVNNSIQVVKSPPALYRLNFLLNFLSDAGAHSTVVASVRRQLLFGGKSRSRTTHKGRNNRRKTRKTRNTRKHRTLRK